MDHPSGTDNLAICSASQGEKNGAKSVVIAKSTPEPVSLDSLKNKVGEASPIGLQPREVKKEIVYSKDRAATVEDMNKLKDLIKEKVIIPVEKTEPKKEEIITPVKNTSSLQGGEENSQNNKVKEVPEDVLRKILE